MFNMPKKNDAVCLTTKNESSANTGCFWMHLLAKNNKRRVRTLLSNLVDFSLFTVDLSEINTENN